MNDATKQMIRDKFLPAFRRATSEDIERAARYMSQELRIGGMTDCRQMVEEAAKDMPITETRDLMDDFNYVGSRHHY